MPDNRINLVNFVRGCEPRKPMDLYTPTAREIAVNRENGLKGTFLLQYDALLRPDFQELFLREQGDDMELGLWLEMCRPLAEAVGIKWRGRPGFDWDWYVNPGFLPAYTPREREALIDEAFRKYHEIFGVYPRSAGSWLLDAHSMAYMSDKYDMDAFCICREQYAVDAYTLWGGCYSGGYYPSRRNMLCPAQTDKMQIKTPVFRMLGIDPIYGYDEQRHSPRLGGCYTMEPCWPCGRDRQVMEWYLRSYFTRPFSHGGHATTGQENSFGWERMESGYRLQAELIKEYSEKGLLRAETLGETGAAFRRKFSRTPVSALSALEDWSGNDLQSVWFSCVNYRTNLFREGKRLYFRDMQCFMEQMTEPYYESPCTQWQASYHNFPLTDNRLWSEPGNEAALSVCAPVDRIERLSWIAEDILEISVRFADGHQGTATFSEDSVVFRDCGRMRWSFGNGSVLQNAEESRLVFRAYDMTYELGISGTAHVSGRNVMLEPAEGTAALIFAGQQAQNGGGNI